MGLILLWVHPARHVIGRGHRHIQMGQLQVE